MRYVESINCHLPGERMAGVLLPIPLACFHLGLRKRLKWDESLGTNVCAVLVLWVIGVSEIHSWMLTRHDSLMVPSATATPVNNLPLPAATP